MSSFYAHIPHESKTTTLPHFVPSEKPKALKSSLNLQSSIRISQPSMRYKPTNIFVVTNPFGFIRYLIKAFATLNPEKSSMAEIEIHGPLDYANCFTLQSGGGSVHNSNSFDQQKNRIGRRCI